MKEKVFLDSSKVKDAIFADLHIHSRFSRACSKNITIENLVKWARVKGLNLLGTGDFTHPVWIEEVKEKLKDNGKGFYYFEDEKGSFPFLITGEISLIYTQERGRRIHLVILVPSIEVAEKINAYLDTKGRRDYDGRPIFKISGEEFVREMRNISEDIEVIPAHAWTPWFGVFGSNSGFDSLKECFGKEFNHVHAIETGISSDPKMNWKIKELESKSIVSFSDAHSFWPFRLGREATIFEKCDSYKEIINQIRNNSFLATIETDPAYGKYHYDGHRVCNFSCSPEETKKLNGICPKCSKPLIIGVENRVEELASVKDFGGEQKPYYTLLPLHEIIGLHLGVKMDSKKSWNLYDFLITLFKDEFEILLFASKEEMLNKGFDEKLVELILRNRQGKIQVEPGYDGEYGVAQIGKVEKQKSLF
jgi:uncharacterized protein (TIGR00375 family)